MMRRRTLLWVIFAAWIVAESIVIAICALLLGHRSTEFWPTVAIISAGLVEFLCFSLIEFEYIQLKGN